MTRVGFVLAKIMATQSLRKAMRMHLSMLESQRILILSLDMKVVGILMWTIRRCKE
jgi:hypothetical protein